MPGAMASGAQRTPRPLPCKTKKSEAEKSTRAFAAWLPVQRAGSLGFWRNKPHPTPTRPGVWVWSSGFIHSKHKKQTSKTTKQKQQTQKQQTTTKTKTNIHSKSSPVARISCASSRLEDLHLERGVLRLGLELVLLLPPTRTKCPWVKTPLTPLVNIRFNPLE